MNNKIKLGYFSFSTMLDPEPYLEWHQNDHMPEQFALPGLPWGARFVSPRSCVDASAAREEEGVGLADSLQLYFMEDPEPLIPRFLALGRELAGAGRLRTELVEFRMQASLQLVNCYVAPRVHIGEEVVPYKPNHGAYVIVEHVDDVAVIDDWVTAQHRAMPELMQVPGVIGLWSFASTGAYGVQRTRARASMIYLDDDPIAVAERLDSLLVRRWKGAPVHPMLAGPFRSLHPPPSRWNIMDDDPNWGHR
jgi:hypothetical protein